mgnify:CR=1 FL=1
MIKSTNKLAKGDIVFATIGPDGHRYEIQNPIEVAKVIGLIDNGPGTEPTMHFQIKQPKGLVSPDRYFMTGAYPKVEYARKVTLAGVRFYKMDDDLYKQIDGAWTIEADFLPYECDDEHPVKLSRQSADAIVAQPHLWSYEAVNGARDFLNGQRNPDTGKYVRGYLCRGGEEHYERQWVANNSATDTEFDHRGLWCDTPTEVAELIRDNYYKV